MDSSFSTLRLLARANLCTEKSSKQQRKHTCLRSKVAHVFLIHPYIPSLFSSFVPSCFFLSICLSLRFLSFSPFHFSCRPPASSLLSSSSISHLVDVRTAQYSLQLALEQRIARMDRSSRPQRWIRSEFGLIKNPGTFFFVLQSLHSDVAVRIAGKTLICALTHTRHAKIITYIKYINKGTDAPDWLQPR